MTESGSSEGPKMTRRDFLKKAAIAAAGLAVGGVASGCEPTSGELTGLTEEDKKTLEEILKKQFVPADENEEKVLKEMEGKKNYLGQTEELVMGIKILDAPEVYMVSEKRRNNQSADKDYSIFAEPFLGEKVKEVENSVHFPFWGYPIARVHVKVIPAGEIVGEDVYFLAFRESDANPKIRNQSRNEHKLLFVCVRNEMNPLGERQIFERIK